MTNLQNNHIKKANYSKPLVTELNSQATAGGTGTVIEQTMNGVNFRKTFATS